jgi:hypothetical protein
MKKTGPLRIKWGILMGPPKIHEKTTAVKPQTQIASRTADTGLAAEGTAKSGAVADGAKGWLISSIATGNGDCAI